VSRKIAESKTVAAIITPALIVAAAAPRLYRAAQNPDREKSAAGACPLA